MKPKNQIKNKVSLKFMDISVSLEGGRKTETRALKLFSSLLQDRLKVFEVMTNLDHEEEDAELQHKKMKLKVHSVIKPDCMFA